MPETYSYKFGLTQKQYQLIENTINSFSEIEKVIIFGSRATGKCRASSDIDLAIVSKNLNRTVINRLASALDDLPLPFMFDLLNYDAISNSNLKDKIGLQGKFFFERQLNTA